MYCLNHLATSLLIVFYSRSSPPPTQPTPHTRNHIHELSILPIILLIRNPRHNPQHPRPTIPTPTRPRTRLIRPRPIIHHTLRIRALPRRIRLKWEYRDLRNRRLSRHPRCLVALLRGGRLRLTLFCPRSSCRPRRAPRPRVEQRLMKRVGLGESTGRRI